MMELINKLIIWVNENGLSNLFYHSSVVITFVAVLLFSEFYRRHYGLKRSESAAALVIVFPLSYVWMLLITWAENGFTNFGDNNMVRLFVWVPVFILLAARVLNRDALTLTDFLAPSACLVQAIGHVTCIFPGCCHGYPASWGLVNYQLSRELWSQQFEQTGEITGEYVRVFPNQWLECLTAFLVFFAVKLYAKKTGYDGRGKAYPLFLILFGITRFFLEFLRDNPKLFWNISELALHALSMVAVGTVWLLVLKKHPHTPKPAPKTRKKNA